MTSRTRRLLWPAGVLLLLLTLAAPAVATAYPVPAQPIPSASPSTAPGYVGAPATAHPVSASAIPANPWMAAGSWSNGHNDTYMSDTYAIPGPLGRSPQVSSSWLGEGAANSIGFVGIAGFDAAGNIITPVVRGTVGSLYCTVTLTLLAPGTMDVLAECERGRTLFGGLCRSALECRQSLGFDPTPSYSCRRIRYRRHSANDSYHALEFAR